jgi:hypothetical protein
MGVPGHIISKPPSRQSSATFIPGIPRRTVQNPRRKEDCVTWFNVKTYDVKLIASASDIRGALSFEIASPILGAVESFGSEVRIPSV